MDLAARIAPFFLLIAVGVLAGRLRWLDDDAGRGLAAYTFWIGFPALLIRWLGDAPVPDAATVKTLAVYAASMALVFLLALTLGRLAHWSPTATRGAAACAAVGNTAFLGAPVAVALMGPSVQGVAASLVGIDFTLMTALAAAALGGASGKGGAWRAVGHGLFNPTVAGAAIGVALAVGGIRLWTPADQALTLLAATASPVALVALGGLIGRLSAAPDAGERAPLATALVLKLAVAPALVWAALSGLSVDGPLLATAVLLAACPTAVNIFIQTRYFRVFEHGAALTIAAGAAASVLTLMWLASRLVG